MQTNNRLYTDEQLAKMNAYFKDGNALRSTMRSILKDLIRDYKQVRDEMELTNRICKSVIDSFSGKSDEQS